MLLPHPERTFHMYACVCMCLCVCVYVCVCVCVCASACVCACSWSLQHDDIRAVSPLVARLLQ